MNRKKILFLIIPLIIFSGCSKNSNSNFPFLLEKIKNENIFKLSNLISFYGFSEENRIRQIVFKDSTFIEYDISNNYKPMIMKQLNDNKKSSVYLTQADSIRILLSSLNIEFMNVFKEDSLISISVKMGDLNKDSLPKFDRDQNQTKNVYCVIVYSLDNSFYNFRNFIISKPIQIEKNLYYFEGLSMYFLN